MATKGTKKRPNIGIDEEKDFFLIGINKQLRNARKKMNAIEELEKKDRSTLKPEQLEKLKARAEILETIKYHEGIKDLYYAAYKTAQDEGKAPTQETATRKKTTEEDKTEEAAPATEEPQQQVAAPAVSQEDREAEKARITSEVVSKVVNLVHFAQLFRDQSSAQEFRQAMNQFRLDSVPDLESFHEFYVKVFTFSESDRLGKVGDKVNESVRELESYINAVDQPALRNKTYKHLQNVVENVALSSFFRDRNAEVAIPKTRTEPSAIGSELRKGHEQQEAPAPVQQQEKTKSPEKAPVERSPEKPVQTQQETGKQDWGALEDEEDEEDEPVREEQAREENVEGEGGRVTGEEEKLESTTTDKKKQDDDGFITVGAKHKDKKDDNAYKGSGTRPRGGRGGYRGEGRGGYRGEGRGGYRGERREGEEGQEGGYRPRPRRDDQQEGEGGEGQRGGYRGGRGGYRGEGRGGYRGEGRGGYQGRGGYRGGDRREGDRGTNEQRTGGNEAGRTE